jgi:hypothetical protein
MSTKQKEGRLALLHAEEIRLGELIDLSRGLEAIFLTEGERLEAKRQRTTRLAAIRELQRVEANILAAEKER